MIRIDVFSARQIMAQKCATCRIGGLEEAADFRYHDIEPQETAVAQLVVRNLEDDVKARLQRRARRHGRSTEEEVREILRNAVRDGATRKPLGSRVRERFADIGLEDELPELRGEARPAELEP